MSETLGIREVVLAFVREYPGAHTREIERQLRLSNKLADYHLDALESEGLVTKLADHGYMRYFDPELAKALRAPEKRLFFFARRPPALQILVTLAARGELTQGEITKTLGLAKASTTYYLNALKDGGILAMRVDGRHRHYRLRDAERVHAFLATFKPLPGEVDAFVDMWRDLFRT